MNKLKNMRFLHILFIIVLDFSDAVLYNKISQSAAMQGRAATKKRRTAAINTVRLRIGGKSK
ncbi:MAG: hypothetical protein IKS42_10530 [Oscillospiraceae bacterium]|nr:hypothetical protein [Oscillospiraceae bacterium]